MVDFASSVVFTVKLPHCDYLEQMLLIWLCVLSVIQLLPGVRSHVTPGTSRNCQVMGKMDQKHVKICKLKLKKKQVDSSFEPPRGKNNNLVSDQV